MVQYPLSSDNSNLAEAFTLLGSYAALVGSLPTFRDSLSVPSSRVKLLILEGGTDKLS